MSFAYEMGFRPPRCNGCEYAQLKHGLGDRFLRIDDDERGWVAVYELDREPAPGQGMTEHDGRPVRHRVTFMSIGHSDECYHWKPRVCA